MESKLNGRILPYNAILPPCYPTENKKYPVFYLLHGLFGSFENWVTLTGITEYARDYDFLIICPEGGDRWYTDNHSIKNHFYESYILDELIPDVENRFGVSGERKLRAIGGLSMGGYGAFKMAFHRPEMFDSAISMSGAFDVPAFLENENDKWAELNPPVRKAFAGQTPEKLQTEDLFFLAESFNGKNPARTLPGLFFDCGTEDSLIDINRNFSATLARQKIPHHYAEFPGGHDWDYWDQRIRVVLNTVARRFGVKSP